MDDVSVFHGLSHPRCRPLNGHDTGDTFLTANNLAPVTYRNTVSLDQYAAARIGKATRLGSLSLSADGGVGFEFLMKDLQRYVGKSGRPVILSFHLHSGRSLS